MSTLSQAVIIIRAVPQAAVEVTLTLSVLHHKDQQVQHSRNRTSMIA